MSDPANGSQNGFRYKVGEWSVDPTRCTLVRNETSVKLGPRAMNVLTYLAERPTKTVTHHELLEAFWPRTSHSANAVHKCIAELRQVFGEVSREASYIETVSKRGYRLVAAVTLVDDSSQSEVLVVSIGTKSALLNPVDLSALSVDARTVRERFQREMTARLSQLSNFALRTQYVPSSHLMRPNLASQLGADYVVDVDLHESGDSATLVISPTSYELPSHREYFDGGIGDRYVVRNHLIEQVADHLKVLLDVVHLQRMRDWGTKNVHAYRHALEGYSLRQNASVAAFERAEKCFSRALVQDPSFGFAYRELASVYVYLGLMAADGAAFKRAHQRLQSLLRHGRLAQVAPNVVAYLEQTYRTLCLTNPLDTESFWREELIRNPNNPDGLLRYGYLLLGAGLLDESERYLARAIQLVDEANGYSWDTDYITLADARGDDEEHIRLAKNALDRFPELTITLFGLVEKLSRLHRFREAESYLSRLEASDEDGAWAYAAKSRMLAFRGDIPLGSEALKRTLENPLLTNISRGHLCFILGDVESGVRFWRAIEPHFLEMIWRFKPCIEPNFASHVTDDPRYQALLDDFGLGRAWTVRLQDGVRELQAITGIPMTTPI